MRVMELEKGSNTRTTKQEALTGLTPEFMSINKLVHSFYSFRFVFLLQRGTHLKVLLRKSPFFLSPKCPEMK